MNNTGTPLPSFADALTVGAIARLLGVSLPTARKLVKTEMAYLALGTGKRVRLLVSPDIFAQWLEQHRHAPTAAPIVT